MKRKFEPLDLSDVKTRPLDARASKVSTADFARSSSSGASFRGFLIGLPEILAGAEFRSFVRDLSDAVRSEKDGPLWRRRARR